MVLMMFGGGACCTTFFVLQILSMEKYLDRLVQLERFAEAAEVRDEIRELRNRDLWAILEAELNCAVREERYLDAARVNWSHFETEFWTFENYLVNFGGLLSTLQIRDELKLVPPPPGVKAESASMDELPPINPSPASECVSEGIRIAAQSFLLEEESSPPDNTFVFGYKVVIANESPRTVQLVRRHLRIRTESAVAELNGVGVIGKQPVLTPNEKFSYTCMCPLTASEVCGDAVWGEWHGLFSNFALRKHAKLAGRQERYCAGVHERLIRLCHWESRPPDFSSKGT